MKYVGIDLHKKTISGCVVVKERGKRKIAARKRLECRDEAGIKNWFRELGRFEVVVEAATASYEWFVKLVEPLARRVVLAHLKKLRIIEESKRKSDKLDAQVNFSLFAYLTVNARVARYGTNQCLSISGNQ